MSRLTKAISWNGWRPWPGLGSESLTFALTCNGDGEKFGKTNLLGQVPLELLDFVVDTEGRRLIPNPLHRGEQMTEEYRPSL